jgi:hypothetical protein
MISNDHYYDILTPYGIINTSNLPSTPLSSLTQSEREIVSDCPYPILVVQKLYLDDLDELDDFDNMDADEAFIETFLVLIVNGPDGIKPVLYYKKHLEFKEELISFQEIEMTDFHWSFMNIQFEDEDPFNDVFEPAIKLETCCGG